MSDQVVNASQSRLTGIIALMIIIPLLLLGYDTYYDYIIDTSTGSWQFPENRIDSGVSSGEVPVILKGPVTTDEQIWSALNTTGLVSLENTTVSTNLNLDLASIANEQVQITARNVNFLGKVTLEGGYNRDQYIRLDIQDSQFQEAVTVEGSYYDINFEDCLFNKDVKFDGHFGSIEYFSLYGSTFEGEVAFDDLNPIFSINLYDVVFKDRVEFFSTVLLHTNTTRLRAHQTINIRWSQFGEEWLRSKLSWAEARQEQGQPHGKEYVESQLLFWKNNFSQLGYTRDERKVTSELIKFRRSFLNPLQVEWWVSFLSGLPSEYGTHPYRPLWLGLLVINCFAILYWKSSAFVLKKDKTDTHQLHPLLFSFLYSLDTFIPFITVTGVKEWEWELSPQFRRIELIERLLGLLLATLSAYSYIV